MRNLTLSSLAALTILAHVRYHSINAVHAASNSLGAFPYDQRPRAASFSEIDHDKIGANTFAKPAQRGGRRTEQNRLFSLSPSNMLPGQKYRLYPSTRKHQ